MSISKDIRNIKYNMPKGHVGWVDNYNNKTGERFIVTSLEHDRSTYYLYQVGERGGMTRIAQRQNPREFDSMIFGKK